MEIITGRVTADATVNTTKSNKQVVHFSVASNHGFKPNGGQYEQITNFFRCSYWLNAAVAEVLKKGTQVTLYGRTNVDLYQDKDGNMVGSLNFNVNEILPTAAGLKVNPAKPLGTINELATAAVQNTQGNDDLPF